MAKDVKGEKVEDYKLTKGQKDWTKSYKGHLRVKKLLEGKSFQLQREASLISSLWKLLQREHQNLVGAMPKDKLQELQGMDFKEEEEDMFQTPEGGPQTPRGPQQGQEGGFPSRQQQMINY